MPQEIDLSADWHLVLDRMRDETTSDGVKRWIEIGYKDDRTGLWLRNAPLMGRRGSVPSELIDHGLGRMKYYGKMTGVLGDIHSHPRISAARPIVKLLDSIHGFLLGRFLYASLPGFKSNDNGSIRWRR